jgi:hypothetical protein
MNKRILFLMSGLILVLSLGLLLLFPPKADPLPQSFGWLPDREQVAAVVATIPQPHFQQTEAYRTAYSGPEEVFLWDASRKVLGHLIPARDQQNIGSCVSFGTASAIEHLQCVQIAHGSPEEYRDLAQEVIYGGSRVEIGGGRIRGDGSVGAWAAKFVVDYGVLPRGFFGRHDLRNYDVARCRSFGLTGVPDELEAETKQHPVKAISNVRSWPEAQAAIRNGYPLIVCSNQGFRMTRDADGFCAPSGTWFHCMALVGIRGGTRPGGFLLNSWGETAHTGPGGLGEPSPAGFWADAEILDRMLRQGDSWAFSGVRGFPAKKLNWYAQLQPQNGGLPCVRF